MIIEVDKNMLLIKINDNDKTLLAIPTIDVNNAHVIKMAMEVYAEKKLCEHLKKMLERRQDEKDNDYH